MERWVRAGFLCCAISLWGQWRTARPEESAPTFRANVSQVRVDVEVAIGSRAILGLRSEDFLVRDNGVEQRVVNLGREEVPLDVMLLFDVSGSMRPITEEVASVARQALAELKNGDRAGVAYFTTHATLAQGLTSNLDRVDRAIRDDVLRQPFNGGTNILAGIEFCGQQFPRLKEKEARRRAILVITDNKGTYSNRETQIIEGLWEADVVASGLIVNSDVGGVPGIVMGPGRRGGAAPRIPGLSLAHGMNHVADETGGDCLKASHIPTDFPLMMQRLRNRYSLYYPLPKGQAGEHRRVLVELSARARGEHPAARVYARKGYLMPESITE